MNTHSSWYAHCVNVPHKSEGGRKGPGDHPHLAIDFGFLKADNPDDLADQGSNPILIGAEAKYGRTLAMAVPGKGNAAPWIAKRVADWLHWLGSQTVTLNGSITIFEHPYEERSRATILLWAA